MPSSFLWNSLTTPHIFHPASVVGASGWFRCTSESPWIWQNQTLLIWTGGWLGGKIWMGPEPSAPVLNRERRTSFHQEEKSAACLTSPPKQERKEVLIILPVTGASSEWGGTQCVTGGPIPAPSPVFPVWIYWLGGEQTLTGRQQTRTKERGNDAGGGFITDTKDTRYFSMSLSGS